MNAQRTRMELIESPLVPAGYRVPVSRWIDSGTRMRELLETEPYLFGPGIFDPHGAEIAMYHGFKAVYFSGYSFAIGHLGTTDMDLYSGPEIADGARRTVSALRKFQLTAAVGDPEKGVPPRHLEIPPVVVDMDGGYGNVFNVQRTTEMYVNAGVAAAHLEDQVLPKRCGHIGGKALIDSGEMIGKLRMARAVSDDLGRPDFVIIARTDGVSAMDASESARGLELAVERALRYLDTGIPDLVWCEFPTSDRAPVEDFADRVRRRFPEARFAFNWSSSFKWFNDPSPLRFAELGELEFSRLLQGMRERQEQAYIELQRAEWAPEADIPTRSHHLFSGVPYHQLLGEELGGARLGQQFQESLPAEKVV
ncbi:MAG: hypothetical protein AUH85_02650 [Chloroflexi bacterium 13_1_40CM_4_68_4]|nr:MAG: hypothetical protein AUH85_02650 [Chloroflexi bacterium 13_1_40CM_4_68_4]